MFPRARWERRCRTSGRLAHLARREKHDARARLFDIGASSRRRCREAQERSSCVLIGSRPGRAANGCWALAHGFRKNLRGGGRGSCQPPSVCRISRGIGRIYERSGRASDLVRCPTASRCERARDLDWGRGCSAHPRHIVQRSLGGPRDAKFAPGRRSHGSARCPGLPRAVR